MNSCQYQEVVYDDGNTKWRKDRFRPLLKQILVASTSWVQYFMAGVCVGAPTVIIAQIRKDDNSTIVMDDEMASWLYSTCGLAMFPWILILPFFIKFWGRKLPQLGTAVISTLSFTILYFSENPYHIIIAEVFQGVLSAGNMTIRILIVTEYTSIKYRGLFLSIKSASFFWGLLVANAIGTYFYWKYIAVLGLVCSLYTFSFVFFPESPYWLASKGRIEECKASYRWIHGSNETSEKHLNKLIVSFNVKKEDLGFIETLKDKEFYKPMAICLLCVMQYHFSGKLMCSLYILDIIKNITESESTAYSTMLILDGITVLGMYTGSFLSNILKRRTLYLTSSFAGVFILLIISLYLYLVRFSVLIENNYLTIALLMMYSLSISCGPMILNTAIFGEIIPLKFQTTCYIITGLAFALFFSVLSKLTPTIFASFGIHGTFLFYFLTCGLCTIYLYIYVPETKDKTHEEIALYFRGKRNNDDSTPLR